MKQFLLVAAALLLHLTAYCTGYDVKTSSIIDQPDIEVLGDYKGCWYAIGFEKPGNLNKPPRYKIFKYAAGFPSAKSSVLYPSFGEKTLYLKAAIIHNKISLFYGECEKRVEVNDLIDGREGHRQIYIIYRQDYDVNTLEPLGEPAVVFDQEKERFAASGLAIAQSYDGTKTAVLIKCYYRQQNYKIILTDNNSGTVYEKTFDLKPLKEYLCFQQIKVGNTGQVLIQTKVRDDVISLADSKEKKFLYYFFAIDNAGNMPKSQGFAAASGRDKFMAEPVIDILPAGQMLIAHTCLAADKSPVVKSIAVFKYDTAFNPAGSRDVAADATIMAQALPYQAKKENGLPYLQLKQIVPTAEGFVLVAEYNRLTEKDAKNPRKAECHYIVAYRFDENLAVKETRFIAKKQTTAKFDFALSIRAYARGNDVFLFYNDTWESDEEHGITLQCTRLPGGGGEPETRKVVVTHEDFFTCLKNIYPRKDGKVLFTEEKLVEFDDIQREVKFLEVTIK